MFRKAMRKINPRDVCSDFESAIDELEEFYSRQEQVTQTKTDLSLIAEHVLLTAAILWEGFISDLLIGYVNRDSKKIRERLERRFSDSVKAKFGETLAAHATLKLPPHPTKDEVAGWLDDNGSNVSFPTSRKLVDRATEILAPTAAAGFSGLAAADLAVIDAWISIRNYLAHRSTRAKATMNDALLFKRTSTANTALNRVSNKVSDVGAYLKAKPKVGADARLVTYLARMRDIAKSLAGV